MSAHPVTVGRLIGLSAILFLLMSNYAAGQTVLEQPRSEVDLIVIPNAERADRDVDFVALPIPISNPTIGTGIGLVGAVLYDLDETSQVSMSGVGVFRTNNGSKGAAVFQQTNFMDGLIRTQVGFGGVDIKYDFFGIGQGAGDAGVSIPISQRGLGVFAKAKARVRGKFYAGLQFQYVTANTAFELDDFLSPDQEARFRFYRRSS